MFPFSEIKNTTLIGVLICLVLKSQGAVAASDLSSQLGQRAVASSGERVDVTQSEDKLARYVAKLDAFRKDVFEQMHHLENRLEDRIYQFEKSWRDTLPNTSDGKKTNNFIEHSMSDLKVEVATIKADLGYVEREIKNYMNESVANLKEILETFNKDGHTTTKEFAKEIKEECSTVSVQMSREMNSAIGILKDALETRFVQLSTAVHNDVLETQGLLLANALNTSEIRQTVTALLTPTHCSKGMHSFLPVSTLPYLVIQPGSGNGLPSAVLCDTFTDNGGWIVIQRRSKGDISFYRDWAAYKQGFGSLDGDFWLGNKNIHAISSRGVYELRIDLRHDGKSAFAHYGTFYLDAEDKNYALHLGPYSGTAGDSLKYHKGMAFTTYDRDNDIYKENCAELHRGGWWYHHCHDSNLNGEWLEDNLKGPRWGSLTGSGRASFTEMKIRLVF